MSASRQIRDGSGRTYVFDARTGTMRPVDGQSPSPEGTSPSSATSSTGPWVGLGLLGVAMLMLRLMFAGAPDPPQVQPPPVERATLIAVKSGKPLAIAAIRAMNCSDLWLHRNWIFARHHMTFAREVAARAFATQPGYRADPMVTWETVGSRLTATDSANRDAILAVECERGCSDLPPGICRR